MNPFVVARSAAPRRVRLVRVRGYTLLEVLIALALLATLIAVMAGLMSVFSRAETKAQASAQELRVLRSVRALLGEDLRLVIAPMVSDEQGNAAESTSSTSASPPSSTAQSTLFSDPTGEPSVTTPPSSSRSVGGSEDVAEFEGTTLGFRCRVALDDDPGRWLEALVPPPGLDTEMDSPLDSLPRMAAPSSETKRPSGEADLEWRLAADTEFPGFGQRLIRRITPRFDRVAPVSGQRDPNALLDASDLYRIDDGSQLASEFSTNSNATTLPPLEAVNIRNALFRYSDGEQWYRSWSSRSRRGLPVAVELTFELGAELVAEDSLSELSGGLGASGSSTNSLSASAGIGTELEAEATLPETETLREIEYRIVLLVGSAKRTPPATTGERAMSGRGLSGGGLP